MEKLNEQVAYDLFESKGYKTLEKYKNSSTPLHCEKDGYWYKISYSNLRIGKKPSLWGFNNICNLEHNVLNFIAKEKANCSFIGYDIISKNKKRRIMLHLKCSCGEFFDKTLEDFVYKKYKCCNNCALKKRGNTRRNTKATIDFIESKGFKILNKKDSYRKDEYIEVMDINGFKGFVKYCYLKSHKGMSKFDVRVNKKNYIYNVNNWAKIQNINAECIGFSSKEYTTQALTFKCECGNIFETSISSFQSGKTRCSECAKSISSYEKEFKDYLDNIGIKYIYQYSLNQCRDILPLPFDFYIAECKKIVEIDGEGHFYPCYFNNMSKEKSLKSFELTKKHDAIKNNFCEKNNIPLLRIPYTAMQDGTFKQIFQKFIEE